MNSIHIHEIVKVEICNVKTVTAGAIGAPYDTQTINLTDEDGGKFVISVFGPNNKVIKCEVAGNE